jgi:hypothetical protein
MAIDFKRRKEQMRNYVMNEKEFNTLERLISVSHMDNVLEILQNEEYEYGDFFWDYDYHKGISLKEGLQTIYESDANEICFENQMINKEDYDIVNGLFKKFGIGSDLKMDRIQLIKQEYLNDEVSMCAILSWYPELTNDEIQELLEFSGDDEYMTVEEARAGGVD